MTLEQTSLSRQFLLTCEHGGNEIPSHYQPLFHAAGEVLQTHQGWDIGALNLARELQQTLQTPLIFSTTSRLLIDLNRSLSNPELLSSYSRALSEEERNRLIASEYTPFRDQVLQHIQSVPGSVQIVHVSVHSFTPVLNGVIRDTDVGILFDPCRPIESQLSRQWVQEIQSKLPGFQIHLNRPYLGTDDGFTTTLRSRFPEMRYVGIELEVNQKYLVNPDFASKIANVVCSTVARLKKAIL
ncbi:N-formylglutamate amidohydrolase [Thalassoglobus polymorphus]|uniref:N-formylglutamate amidohydrolase n=1 Tax=Thalassoglobus polymorphus TaxID=2527994 RepID=A0A517QMN9_9PLAN|nr:N-formylglutamate amidohydrolase [Thalassoglobus polymorphus]QDT32898.1 N-formylglutamate amidohydrolase [Thalassoglobus polymorphus]